jgi:peptidoglycan-N-acetylglucosamine deacetylase
MTQSRVFVTVDVEPDCPPYLWTWRGIDEGMPKLRRLLDEEQIRATMFVTGQVARRRPELIKQLVADGHELACHGDSHRRLSALPPDELQREIAEASDALREHGRVVSFRAPNLDLPAAGVPLLRSLGYLIDSSEGRHKSLRARVGVVDGVLRVPVSVTSSTLRWPAALRNRLLARLSEPAVLFVHPWEFVDFRRTRLRFDCRFRTGDQALVCLRDTIAFFKKRRTTFGTLQDCLTATVA